MISILVIIIIFNLIPLTLLAYYFLKPTILKSYPEPNIQPVSIIIACYNEGLFLESKLNELLADDEWIKGSEIIVVSNGSTDNTSEVLVKFKNNNCVKIYLFEERIGKIQSLNFGSVIAQNDLLIISDSRQRIKKQSVKNLVLHFSNPDVGIVTSMLCDKENTSSFFRKCIHVLSKIESKEGFCFTVHGALYAVRKNLFTAIPYDIIFDDLFMNVAVLAKNKKVICEPMSVIYDLNFETYYKKERIERLTRGLLLFLFNHFKLILKLNSLVLLLFTWHRYGKIINSVLIVSLALTLIIKNLSTHLWLFYILFALLPLLLFNNKIKVICYFIVFQMLSLIMYLFNINRSVDWEKLAIYKNKSERIKI